MPREEDDFIINGPVPIDYGTFGVKSKRLKSGRLKKKYTIEIKAEPLAVAASAMRLSEPLAKAYVKGIQNRISLAGKTDASPATLARRQSWGDSPTGKSASFRFKAPRKKSGGIKGSAVRAPRPDPNARGLYNHSGRLREGLRVMRDRTRFSSSKGVAVWTVVVPANRLHEPSFGRGFHAFLNQFQTRVQPHLAVKDKAYQKELSAVSQQMIRRLSDAVKSKKRYLAVSQARMVGKAFSTVLGL